jgi:lipoprotein
MSQRHLSFVALLAAGALLSGCSGGVSSPSDGANHSPDSNQTFTFSGTLGPVESIHVEFPKPLLDAMGADADNLLVTAVDLKAHKLDSAKYCAVDVTRTFAKGAVETLSAPKKVDYQSMSLLDLWASSDEAGQRLDALLKDSGASMSVKELLATDRGFILKMPAGPDRDARLQDIGLEGFDVDAFNAGVQKLKDELSASTPKNDPTATLLKREGAKPLSELNEASPEPGKYMSDDASVITDVMKCALEPFADSTSDTAVETMRITKTGSSSPEDFAYLRFTIMKDGKITITDSNVLGFQQDSSGNWLKK